ncbi:hypothetical protein [Halorussus aquaticus]|uniref:Uncharacterized protein n=1 Tax=Halorussus aquaticus TaxID=2953748 RepID=A0ABD5Q6G2_9EURY|nr:hypothetical protein [Halorussus aquaticus]
MTSKKRTLSVVLAGVLLLSGVATAGMGSAAAEVTANDSLSVTVAQADDYSSTVTVTHNGSAVTNASVNVSVADDNVTYAGAGEYVTDESGTVELSAPEENVTVEVTAEKNDATGATSATLVADTADEPLEGSLGVSVAQTDDGATVSVTHNGTAVENASVTVGVTDDNTTYAGAGDYTTDASGTVSLPAPEENVTVEITAAKDNATGTATATLTASEGEKSFGNLVSSFVHEMLNAGDDGGPIGQAVSEYVTENNPGNAADKKPDDVGKPDDAGKPDHAGQSDNTTAENGTDEGGSQGPHENAGSDENGGNDKNDGNDKKGNGGSDNGNGKARGNGR